MFHRFRQGVWRHIWNVTLNSPNATNGTLQLSRKFSLFWLWSGHHLHPSTRGFPRHLLPASSLFVQRLTFFVKVRQNYIRRRLKVICKKKQSLIYFPNERQFESIWKRKKPKWKSLLKKAWPMRHIILYNIQAKCFQHRTSWSPSLIFFQAKLPFG